MNRSESFTAAVTQLKAILDNPPDKHELRSIVESRAAVLARYQPLFSLDHIPELAANEFEGFLLLENNCHWSGLQGKGAALAADMDRLRGALGVLLDERQPLKQRLDILRPAAAAPLLHGLGKSLITAILHIVHPDQYGVYNGTSEAAMEAVGLLPSFPHSLPLSERYLEVNALLMSLAKELHVDLWTLDALWHQVRLKHKTHSEGSWEGDPET